MMIRPRRYDGYYVYGQAMGVLRLDKVYVTHSKHLPITFKILQALIGQYLDRYALQLELILLFYWVVDVHIFLYFTHRLTWSTTIIIVPPEHSHIVKIASKPFRRASDVPTRTYPD